MQIQRKKQRRTENIFLGQIHASSDGKSIVKKIRVRKLGLNTLALEIVLFVQALPKLLLDIQSFHYLDKQSEFPSNIGDVPCEL